MATQGRAGACRRARLPAGRHRQGDPLRRLRHRCQRWLRQRRRRSRPPGVAVTTIDAWWKQVGSKRYPDAREIFINADAGGSNGYRLRVWKYELQRFADKYDISVRVAHFPPGTSKWNKVEHRLFSFISINWRGRPLRTYETVVNLIANTTNRGGLVVRARLDKRRYPTGKKIPAKEFKTINIAPDSWHGDWNYVIRPRAKS